MMSISTAMLCRPGYRWFQFDLTMISINLQHKYGTSCHIFISTTLQSYSNVGCLILMMTSCWKFNRQKTATSATLFWTCMLGMYIWVISLKSKRNAEVHMYIQKCKIVGRCGNKYFRITSFQTAIILIRIGHLILINVCCPHVEKSVKFEHLPLQH